MATVIPAPFFKAYFESFESRGNRNPTGSRRGITFSFLDVTCDVVAFIPQL